jgi:hypothetical protein
VPQLVGVLGHRDSRAVQIVLEGVSSSVAAPLRTTIGLVAGEGGSLLGRAQYSGQRLTKTSSPRGG